MINIGGFPLRKTFEANQHTMITKTVRSRFSHEVGEKVEGCTILERRVVIPPQPSERRLGLYDYLVEVLPEPVKHREAHTRSKSAAASGRVVEKSAQPEKGSFTRATPEEMATVIRRVPGR
jgi:hypothetical protein